MSSRQLVDAEKLSFLMASHARHFATYSKGKVKCTQTIPNKIWPLVESFYIDAVIF
jgi:hypothetical protein